MALSRLSLAFSLLLLSLLVIASAGDYGDGSSKYGFDGIPADSPQATPEEEEKSHYGTKPDYYKPKPVDKEKPGYGDGSSKYGFDGIPADSPQAKPEGEEKSHFGTKPDYYKPKPVDKEKPGYGDGSSKYGFDGIPADSPQAKPEEEKHYYSTKPDNYKQAKPEEKPGYGGEKKPVYKPKTEEKEKPQYDRKPYVVKPEPKGEEKPYYGTKPEEKENRLSIAVQGLVLCKSGSKYEPIQGAFAAITCKAVDEAGAEKTLSICSGATDAKGYFLATLSDLGRDKLKLRECKAYLKSSPLETCNVPTNVNKAIEGALLSAFRVLKDKKTKLYSVGPFFYTSETKAAPKYGY